MILWDFHIFIVGVNVDTVTCKVFLCVCFNCPSLQKRKNTGEQVTDEQKGLCFPEREVGSSLFLQRNCKHSVIIVNSRFRPLHIVHWTRLRLSLIQSVGREVITQGTLCSDGRMCNLDLSAWGGIDGITQLSEDSTWELSEWPASPAMGRMLRVFLLLNEL